MLIFQAKIFPILYPTLEKSTTRVTILDLMMEQPENYQKPTKKWPGHVFSENTSISGTILYLFPGLRLLHSHPHGINFRNSTTQLTHENFSHLIFHPSSFGIIFGFKGGSISERFSKWFYIPKT